MRLLWLALSLACAVCVCGISVECALPGGPADPGGPTTNTDAGNGAGGEQRPPAVVCAAEADDSVKMEVRMAARRLAEAAMGHLYTTARGRPRDQVALLIALSASLPLPAPLSLMPLLP